MLDGLKQRKFVHLEQNDDGHWHCDSVNPKTGGQLNIHETIEAWITLGRLIQISPQYNEKPPNLDERAERVWDEYHEWSTMMSERMREALEIVAPGCTKSELRNVGVRRSW